MATAPESVRGGLLALSDAALAELAVLLQGRRPKSVRDALLAVGPSVVDYRATGATALAADWFEELREESNATKPYAVVLPEWQREEKFARALVWATEPLDLDDPDFIEALSRLGSAVEYETFDAFSTTMDANVREDSEARGWSRNANYGACKFCRMLADRGAVYRKESSARFAAHTNCRCTYVPAFTGHGAPEASVIQYVASKRRTTAKDRARVRAYLNEHFPDAPG